MHAVPVGHHEAVEAPLVAQDLGEEPPVVGGVLAGDLVVRAHDAPGAPVLDRSLERPEVQLAQRAFVDVDVDGHPLDLGVVGDEVLDGHGHVVCLDPAHPGGRERAGELGVFAVALERPAADRRAMEVDGGSEHDVSGLADGLGSHERTEFLGQVRIPGGARGDARRHHHAWCSGSTVAFAADAVGSVGHLDLRNAGLGERVGAPGRLAGHEAALVVE